MVELKVLFVLGVLAITALAVGAAIAVDAVRRTAPWRHR